MNIFKRPYEISLWEDRLTLVDSNFNEYDGFVSDNISAIGSYYKEIKICVIGANDLDSPIRAISPKLTKKIDGSKTLTFSIYSHYYDEDNQLVQNPYLPYLTNERKVKLKYQEGKETKWADFIIKRIAESSENYLYTYTAEDYFVNELSKSGLNLVFDQELENNQGNITWLAERILEGTDWRISENTELIQQKQEEALYKIKLRTGFTATNVLTGESLTIPSGETIYAFYTSIANREEQFFQFLYNSDNNYEVDENRVITNSDEFWFSFSSPDSLDWPFFAETLEYTGEFRGSRHVRSQKFEYDKALGKYVYIYENQGQEYRGYTEVDYITSNMVRSYITSSSTFSGWEQKDIGDLEPVLVPSYNDVKNFQAVRIPTIKYIQTPGNFLFNSGMRDNAFYLEDIIQGDEHRFRIKCGKLSETKDSLVDVNLNYKIECRTFSYNIDGTIADKTSEDITLFSGTIGGNSTVRDSEGYAFGDLKALTTITKQQLQEKPFGIFITLVGASGEFHLVDAQLFKKYFDENGNLIYPNGKVLKENGEIVSEVFEGRIDTTYYYYLPGDYSTPEEIVYTYIGKETQEFKPKYDETYEKIRSITASGSNRFNLLQQLSETFECWCKIDAIYKETGEIFLKKDFLQQKIIDSNSDATNDINSTGLQETSKTYSGEHLTFEEAYRPQKFISFHSVVGQNNPVDFIAGLNLKNISRNLETTNFVTKLIVKNNNNEFAKNGSCNIARASENPINDNFLINFDYYIKMGLLNYDNFYNDLYSMSTNRGWLGYYTRLKSMNTELNLLGEEIVALASKTSLYESDYQIALEFFQSLAKELKNSEDSFKNETTFSFEDIPADSTWLQEPKIIALGEKILQLRNQTQLAQKDLNNAKQKQDKLNELIQGVEIAREQLIEEKRVLNASFDKKYSRFIQEAPWSSDDYIDDNLYYLDAESTLHNSAQPKVSYTINVLDLSSQEDFENYTYSLGDITHMQDPEFFGYTYAVINGQTVRTPYREKIVVTETVTDFDNPEKDTIKVQNYRTQFEDLFQRMAATTQKVEFYSGAYQKAADAISPNGQISSESLKDAFSNNSYILKNANNQSVVWDKNGIVTKNQNAPNEIVRIVGGGVFVTEDGGNTWSTGITGRGINARTITTGSLNTEVITIMSNSQPAFRWDQSGLSAYKKEANGVYNNQTYVRYDQFGIYGIKNRLEAPTSLTEIWKDAEFALTWDGFKLKTGNGKGSVEIGTTSDLVVKQGEEVMLKIGRIDEFDSSIYGITIKGEGEELFRATAKGLNVAGWTLEPGAFVGQYENNMVALYSKGQEKALGGFDKKNWFITAGENFGVDFSGAVYASAGQIGGWTIGKEALYVENTNAEEDWEKYKLYLGFGGGASLNPTGGSSISDLIFKAGNNFGVDKNGELYAFKGRIGGWTLEDGSLSTGDGLFYLGSEAKESNGYMLQIGNNFGVTASGKLITKDIEATKGSIGGWKIDENSISTSGIRLLKGEEGTNKVVLQTKELLLYEQELRTCSKEIITQEEIVAPLAITSENVEIKMMFTSTFVIPDTTEAKEPAVVEVKAASISVSIFQGEIAIVPLKKYLTADFIRITETEEGLKCSVSGVIICELSPGTQPTSQSGTATIDIDYAASFPAKTPVAGFQITSDGEVSLAKGTIGKWNVSENLLSSECILNKKTGIYEQITISTSRIIYQQFEKEEDESLTLINTLTKTWEALLS